MDQNVPTANPFQVTWAFLKNSETLSIRGVALCIGMVVTTCFSDVSQADVIFSDDFSGYNPANPSESDYVLVDEGTYTAPGDYGIVNNPADPTFGNNYGSFFDHTSGDANGAMLFFDGATFSAPRVYYHFAHLLGGVTYAISGWEATGSLGSAASLQVYVGTDMIDTTQLVSTETWTYFMGTYTTTLTGDYVFSIRDANTDSLNNFGAIDDIMLVSVPEPASLSLGLVAALTLIGYRRIHVLKKRQDTSE